MSVTDLIADQMTVIRNGIMAGKKDVIIKKSGIIEGIVGIIKKEGFITDYALIEDNRQNRLKIYFKSLADGTPVLENIQRVSRPGRRYYVTAKKVKKVMGGVGIAILSTSKGLFTDQEAREQGVGGEVICRVW
ncbi:MAG: 30S ribosomal protein S8 [Candidatus Omnitrophica bacterium]|nr:30S ribosomal protein S8 [Candidatus Omnitrophota bacterium]